MVRRRRTDLYTVRFAIRGQHRPFAEHWQVAHPVVRGVTPLLRNEVEPWTLSTGDRFQAGGGHPSQREALQTGPPVALMAPAARPTALQQGYSLQEACSVRGLMDGHMVVIVLQSTVRSTI